jgi:hypothetical protein
MAKDDTSKFESAQALFCSLADYAGASKADEIFDIKLYPNYEDFKSFWNSKYRRAPIETAFAKHVKTEGITLQDIEDFLIKDKKNEWYKSSVLIAKTLIQDIDKISKQFAFLKTQPSTWSDILYVRKDKEIMGNIESLFNEADENQKKIKSKPGSKAHIAFGDINKWSPADIYFATPEAKQKINMMVRKKEGLTFTKLNLFIFELINKGELLPLSLKKQINKVTILPVNFSRPEELKRIKKLKYYGTSDWKPRSKQLNSPKPTARDLKVWISSDKKSEYIQFEHGATAGAFKIIYFSAEMDARGGALSSPRIFIDLTYIADKSKFLSSWLTKYNNANKKFKEEDKKLLNGKPKPNKDTPEGKKYRKERGNLSGTLVTDVVIPDLIKYWDSNQERADETVQILYQYITSRLKDSAAFVIAK